jgi:hypothetical protein
MLSSCLCCCERGNEGGDERATGAPPARASRAERLHSTSERLWWRYQILSTPQTLNIASFDILLAY